MTAAPRGGPGAAGAGRPFRRWPWLVALAVILLAGASPILGGLAAEGLAAVLGCTVDLAIHRPCMLGRADIGQTLARLVGLAMMALVTIPAAGLALPVWLGALMAALALRRRPC